MKITFDSLLEQLFLNSTGLTSYRAKVSFGRSLGDSIQTQTTENVGTDRVLNLRVLCGSDAEVVQLTGLAVTEGVE